MARRNPMAIAIEGIIKADAARQASLERAVSLAIKGCSPWSDATTKTTFNSVVKLIRSRVTATGNDAFIAKLAETDPGKLDRLVGEVTNAAIIILDGQPLVGTVADRFESAKAIRERFGAGRKAGGGRKAKPKATDAKPEGKATDAKPQPQRSTELDPESELWLSLQTIVAHIKQRDNRVISAVVSALQSINSKA